MTDLEMTKLCAEAMGIEVCICPDFEGLWLSGENDVAYDPLHDGAQVMELVKKFPAQCINAMSRAILASTKPLDAVTLDLNRAVVECVAQYDGEA